LSEATASATAEGVVERQRKSGAVAATADPPHRVVVRDNIMELLATNMVFFFLLLIRFMNVTSSIVGVSCQVCEQTDKILA
jgi:hypothetical protein